MKGKHQDREEITEERPTKDLKGHKKEAETTDIF